jgi:hypothetical protein
MNIFQWEDGTVVERPYVEIDGTKYYVQNGTVSGGTPATATNMNEMQNILNNNMLNVDSSGDNYVKLVDGTLICWGITNAANVNYNSEATFDITLPESYTNEYFTVLTSLTYSGSFWANGAVTKGQALTSNSIRVVIGNYVTNHTANVQASYLCIGRWK